MSLDTEELNEKIRTNTYISTITFNSIALHINNLLQKKLQGKQSVHRVTLLPVIEVYSDIYIIWFIFTA